MPNDHQRERELFEEALGRTDPEERRAYLDLCCGRDASLRRRLEQLLAMQENAEGFFRHSPLEEEGLIRPPTTEEDWDSETILQEGPGTIIGRYKLLEVIGKGGFGIVYMAEQTEPFYRRVALKIVKLGMDTKEVIARFEMERQALALMEHPNIARVLDAGATSTGRPYFVMELVPGLSITEFCDQNRYSTRERLELFVPVCHAIQHAHQKGIIHRDLKPSNILVTLHDGRPVPKVIDFGIAKAIEQPLTQRTLFTRFGRMIGTPIYMSPEQSELSGLDVDTRSDIYSLGVVLYELLTGSTPFEPERLRKGAYAEIQRIIQEEEPKKPSTRLSTLGARLSTVAELRNTEPRKLGLLLRGDVDWIVMKTLEKDRNRRYATANGLARDIERHLREEPVSAGSPRLSYRIVKFTRRHRHVVVTTALALLFLLTGLLTATIGFFRASQERDRALAAEAQGEKERQLALLEARRSREGELRERRIAYASDMNLTKAAVDASNMGRALDLLNRHRPAAGQDDPLRDWEWRYLWQQCRSDALARLCQLSNAVYSVAGAPDGAEVAVGGLDGSLAIWDVMARRLKFQIQTNGYPCLAAYSPREKILAATDEKGQVRLWRRTPNVSFRLLEGPARRICDLAFSSDGRRLAGLEMIGKVWVWDMETQKVLASFAGPPSGDIHYGGLAMSARGDWLAAGGVHKHLETFDSLTGRRLLQWPAHDGYLCSLAVSPHDALLASASGFVDSSIKIWDARQGKLLGTLQGHRAWVPAMAFSPDGKILASASADQTIRLWDLESLQLIDVLRGNLHEVWALAFLPDGRTLISGAKDGTVHLWPIRPMPELRAPVVLEGTLPLCVFQSASRHLLCLGTNNNLLRWDGTSVVEMRNDKVPLHHTHALASSSKLGLIAAATQHDKIHILTDTNLEPIATLPLSVKGELSIEMIFSSDGRYLVVLLQNHQVQIWETATWNLAAHWTSEPHMVRSIDLAPNESLLATGGGELRIWDLMTGKLLHQAQAHQQGTDALAFSPDGKHLATGSQEGLAKIWEVGTWQNTATLKGHLLGVHCLAFSPDGRRLATGSVNHEAIKLWDMATYREILNLPLPRAYVSLLKFSPDGNSIVTYGSYYNTLVLKVPSWKEIEQAERMTNDK